MGRESYLHLNRSAVYLRFPPLDQKGEEKIRFKLSDFSILVRRFSCAEFTFAFEQQADRRFYQLFSDRFPAAANLANPWASSRPRRRKLHLFSSVHLREIERRSNRDDAGRINFGVRHVVVTLDVVEVDGLSNAGLLI